MSIILTTKDRTLVAKLAAPTTAGIKIPIVANGTVVREGDAADGIYGCELTEITDTPYVTIFAAPRTGMSKELRTLTCVNLDSVPITVEVALQELTDGVTLTEYTQVKVTLAAGDSMYYEHEVGWSFKNSFGALKGGQVELAQDSIGTILVDTNTIDLTYNDATPSITADARLQMSVTSDTSGIMLSGDAASPGNNFWYGTNGIGTKGWYATSVGLTNLYIPATLLQPQTATGCAALAKVAAAAGQPDIASLDFDFTAAEYAQVSIVMPKKWNESTMTATFYWSHAATAVNFGVRWGIQGVAISNDDVQAVAFGAAVEVTDTGGTTDDLYISDATGAMTISGTPVAADLLVLRVYRDPVNGADNLGVDARLQGIRLTYTTDTTTDA